MTLTKKLANAAATAALITSGFVAGSMSFATTAKAQPTFCVMCDFPADPPTEVGIDCGELGKNPGTINVFIKAFEDDVTHTPATAAWEFGFENTGEFNRFLMQPTCGLG